MTCLAVLMDGQRLPDDEARAFWERFSHWMDGHRDDLAGFARSEGLASVHPEMHDGDPVLVASRTEPQRPYGVARVARVAPKRAAKRASPPKR